MERARQVKAGPRQGKKRTERDRKSLSCWFKLCQGAADLEQKGHSGSSSQISLLSPGKAQGALCYSTGRFIVSLRPWALGGSGLARASVSPQHSTRRHGPLSQRSGFPGLGSRGHSQPALCGKAQAPAA